MWQRLAAIVLKFRLYFLVTLAGFTIVMAYYAKKVQLSYDFVKAIPTDNPKYQQYLSFKKQFGEDGNLLVIGVKTPQFFQLNFFRAYARMEEQIRKIPAVQQVLSIPSAINLVKEEATHQLKSAPVFAQIPGSQHQLDSLRDIFLSLPFYRGLLYNGSTHSYLMAVDIRKQILNSAKRTEVINRIQELTHTFGRRFHETMHLSGLPLIRTVIAGKVAHELKLFLLLSLLLTASILFAFFRSLGTVLISMVVVLIGVICSVATIVLLGFKITLLTGLIPPLIVVIGIPNCVYFLNKYHSEYALHGDKIKALVRMVERMGIVTLFTNLTAAIGFGVFFFTRSAILKEFGIVAGINIMMIFLISFIFLPAILSYLPAPKVHQTRYLDNRMLRGILQFLELLVFKYRPQVYIFTILLVGWAILGMTRLNNESFIVDDLPPSDKISRDLQFFQTNFHGVMPLEILIDTRRKFGVINLTTLQKIDQLSQLLKTNKVFGHPLSIVDGIKFARQAYYNGDSSSYSVPDEFDMVFLTPYLVLQPGKGTGGSHSTFSRLLSAYVDSSKQVARISVNMADIGSKKLPLLLDSLRPEVNAIFDTSQYRVTFTGTSVIFLEGSRFIINGLRDSILLAFLLIMVCMLFLFRSGKMLLICLVPNIIPLVVTAGVMGWFGVNLKPSTVLVFSVALGIAIDVTIRFLVNFKQELSRNNYQVSDTVRKTIHETGLSIIYTGLILFAGFMIFSFSGFGGTRALGWLTSLTLVMAMMTNLTILPALLLWYEKSLKRNATEQYLGMVPKEEEDIDLNRLGLTKLANSTPKAPWSGT
ncbi:MAG: efflux RND transporter permease subunit [Chitinophagaceae bacterium]